MQLWFGNYLYLSAFILANQGYDVWLYNARGTKYSRNHTILNPKSDEFWNFSWHEMGIYDLPATIDYITQQTNHDGIYYFGHSQGCATMYVFLSTIPSYNGKIKTYIHLAPVVFLDNTKSLLITIPAVILSVIDVCMH